MPLRLVLASASAGRLKVLQESGFLVEPRPVDVDETPAPGEPVEVCVRRLARSKLEACPRTLDEVVIAADTLGEHGGRLLGKPASTTEAVGLLRHLRGRTVRYVTGCVVSYDGRVAERTGEALVTLGRPSDEEIDAHVATGEPLRAAGGIDVRGLGAAFVERVEGDVGCAVGLSPHHVWELLTELGVPLADRWAPA